MKHICTIMYFWALRATLVRNANFKKKTITGRVTSLFIIFEPGMATPIDMVLRTNYSEQRQ